jgi:hypothetical protein
MLEPAQGKPGHERLLLLLAPPIVLLLAWLTMRTSGPGLSRIFLSMWVHELGHAVTAWLCGYGAVPGPWITLLGESRNPLVTIVLAAGLGFLAYLNWRADRRMTAAGVLGLLLFQAVLTLGVRDFKARALITFGGDGGLFVLGTALMMTFWAPLESVLHRNRLRWGFLVIGAFAFMDGNHTWWTARHDTDVIPYGEQEYAGESDPTKLTGEFFWTERQMITRYVGLSLFCWSALAGVYLWGVLARPPDP